MSVMVLAATMTSVSESSAKHRRGMAVVENYELSSWHVPDLSGLHLWCAGGRLYSPTRIRRRLAVYSTKLQSACSTCLPPAPCDPVSSVDVERTGRGDTAREKNPGIPLLKGGGAGTHSHVIGLWIVSDRASRLRTAQPDPSYSLSAAGRRACRSGPVRPDRTCRG